VQVVERACVEFRVSHINAATTRMRHQDSCPAPSWRCTCLPGTCSLPDRACAAYTTHERPLSSLTAPSASQPQRFTKCTALPQARLQHHPASLHSHQPPPTPPSNPSTLKPHPPQDPATQAQAEQVLLQFRQSSRPFAACQHILAHSHSWEAKFHAACTIREALVREWALLSPSDLSSLQAYILQYVLQHAADTSLSAVRSTLTGAYAVMVKRGWGDLSYEAKGAVFQQLEGQAVALQTAAARRASLEMMDAVLQEFQLGCASPLGLALEYHERCHSDMEGSFLRQFFVHAAQVGARGCCGGACW
jgi:hypothetical protein